jgi:hypothetical protein
MATVYRTGLIIALEEFFGRVQIFGDELTLAKYCQKERPTERGNQVVAEMVRSRGLNSRSAETKRSMPMRMGVIQQQPCNVWTSELGPPRLASAMTDDPCEWPWRFLVSPTNSRTRPNASPATRTCVMHRRWTRRCSTEWAVVFQRGWRKGCRRAARQPPLKVRSFGLAPVSKITPR